MHILDNTFVWNAFRKILDLFFGLYRKRLRLMRDFGIRDDWSILDIGCGTGQYSQLTQGQYLGLDMDCRYIEQAARTYGSDKKKFTCASLQSADLKGRVYDVALLMDLTHHISDKDFEGLLKILSEVTGKYVIVSDPLVQTKRNYIGRFLTSLDRGKFIRTRQHELAILQKYFSVVKIHDLKFLGIEGMMLFASPKKF